MDACKTQETKLKIPCKKCGKTMLFYQPAAGENAGCIAIEIKCRNRECKAVNEIKLCNRICE